MTSAAAIDLELMRVSMLLDTDPAAAVQRAGALLEQSPGHEGAQLLLATACRNLGDADTAQGLLGSLARAQPGSATLQLEFGRACAAAGRHAEALTAFEVAVALDDRLADAWHGLAAERFIAGDTHGGDQAYVQYDRLAPQPPEFNDAAVALGDRRLDVAIAVIRQRLQKVPDDVRSLRMLATIARARDDTYESEEYLKQCLELAPGYAAARFDLATELCAQQRHTEAMPHVERLLASEPRNPGYLGLKAQTLRFYGHNAEAIALMQQVAADNPDDAKLRLFCGHLLRETGDQAGAIAAYRQALALQPGMGEAYWSLADLKTVRFTAADREAMDQFARRAPPGPGRAQLEFALGKACEDAALYEAAFEHYARGNALHRSSIFFVPDDLSLGVRRSKALYTSRFFAARAGWGSAQPDPIFIVGMPRAGSTLLEQILASHSQVEGTRELPDVPAIVSELIVSDKSSGESNYPDLVATLGRAEIEAYAARYLEHTRVHRPLGRARFVDKMPGNFAHLGLIQLMFPRATLIDARRHPLACCFSCYRQLFGRGQPFSYDLEELGLHYRDYCELMQHFDAVLPGRVHRVYYEQLVADPEAEVRRLLEHCELPFEAGCLRFYENRRVVTTISSEQVRRPINADAVDQWRHFEPWLGKLTTTLGDLVARYPAPAAAPPPS
jgi:tetratricopeptide (TPR) repeat protein